MFEGLPGRFSGRLSTPGLGEFAPGPGLGLGPGPLEGPGLGRDIGVPAPGRLPAAPGTGPGLGRFPTPDVGPDWEPGLGRTPGFPGPLPGRPGERPLLPNPWEKAKPDPRWRPHPNKTAKRPILAHFLIIFDSFVCLLDWEHPCSKGKSGLLAVGILGAFVTVAVRLFQANQNHLFAFLRGKVDKNRCLFLRQIL